MVKLKHPSTIALNLSDFNPTTHLAVKIPITKVIKIDTEAVFYRNY